MSKQRRYYRTAALLGPHEQHAAVRPKARGAHKAIRDIRIPWKAIVPLLAAVGLTLWVVLGSTWYLLWDDLRVTGLTYRELEQTIKVSADMLGYHRFQLKPSVAEQTLETLMPYFSDVEVRCGLIPTSCEISVEERVPVLVWQDASNTYWVDGTGVAFPALLDRPDLPVVRGALPDAGSPYTMTAILKGVTALAELGVPANELECTGDRGLVWTDPEGRRVAFGAGDSMDERWQTYQLMVAHFAETGVAPQQLDVRFRRGITYALGRSY